MPELAMSLLSLDPSRRYRLKKLWSSRFWNTVADVQRDAILCRVQKITRRASARGSADENTHPSPLIVRTTAAPPRIANGTKRFGLVSKLCTRSGLRLTISLRKEE